MGIKFPIKVDIALSAHKVSLLLQAELGGLDFPVGEQFAKHKSQFQQDKAMVFQHVNRLIRCVIDCQLTLGDAVSARHALSLARSFAARVWDNSPLQLKQLDQIGNVAVRKLANAGINSIELLENTEAHRIESVIGRGPPFGMKLLSKLEQFPKLRVLVKMIGKEMKLQKHVKVKLKAEIGFLNQNVPVFFRKKPIYVCFLAETSDGQIVDFRRIVASKLSNGQEIHLTAELTKPSQYISCHVMCDEIAGTCRSAEVRPNLPVSFFPTSTEQTQTEKKDEKGSKSLNAGQPQIAGKKRKASEEFEDGGLDDGDLLAAESVDIMDIDAFDEELASLSATARLSSNKTTSGTKKKTREDDGNDPVRLENGKWACNHKCKDKDKCKHFCCKEGLDKPPKPSKPPKKSGTNDAEDPNSIASLLDAVNDNNKLSSQAPATSAKSQPMSKKSKVDHGSGGQGSSLLGSKEAKSLSKLHEATTPHVQTQTLKLAQGSSKFPETGAQRSSATHGASSGTIVDDEFPDEDVFDSNWGNDIGPEDLEDLGFRGDSVKRAQGTNSGTESHKRVVNDDPWPDFGDDDFNFDDNDASMPEATQVGPDSSLSLIGESNSKQSNKNHSDSNVSVSSGTVRESSSPRANQSKADNAFDDDDGIYDFDTGFDPVQPALDAVDPPENVPYPSSIGESPISPAKNLFFTSPERGPRPATTASAGDAPSSQLRHDDETSTSFSTPAVNARVRSPLPNVSDVTPREFRFRTRKSKHFKDPCGKDGGHVSNNDEGAAVEASEAEEKTKEEEEEQRKKLLMDGIDPAFYDEFKDIVEFI